MGVKYDGMKLVWLKQAGTNKTQVDWVSPDAGDIGTFSGGSEVYQGMKVRVINGPAPVFSIANGTVPHGLTIDPNTGALYGTVNNADGAYEFTLRATSNGEFAERTFSANVALNLPPVWVTNAGTLGNGFDNTLANVVVLAEDPEGQPVTYSVLTGSLPTGLKLDSNTGVISGRLGSVNSNTTYFFTLRASDGSMYADQAFSFTTKYNAPPQWVTPTDAVVISGIEGTSQSFQLEATDATMGQSLTYALVGGALPNGLSLSNTGLITGTLPSVGEATTYQFAVSASDGFKAIARNFKIGVAKNLPPSWISSGSIGQGFGGEDAAFQLQAIDPNGGSITYSLANGSSLPEGMFLDGAFIRGPLPVVENATDYIFTVVATDSTGLTTNRALRFTSLKNLAPAWTSNAALTDALEGVYYSQQLVATDPTGANRPITYSTQDATPDGLTLFANGILRGTPLPVIADTEYTFTVEANSGVLANSRTFTLTIQKDIAPVWVTNTGTVANGRSFYQVLNTAFSALDPNNTEVTYSLVSGVLPATVSLQSDGRLTGYFPDVTNTTTYTFTVGADDGANPVVTRTFNIIVEPNGLPVWTTPAGEIGSGFEQTPFTFTIAATDPESNAVIYYLTEGSHLPDGLALNRDTGRISGTLPHVEQDTTWSFSIWADDLTPNSERRVSRTFSIRILFNSPPVWLTVPNLGTEIEGTNYSNQLNATGVGNGPMIYTVESGALPSGLTLSRSGLISGVLPTVANDTEYTFEIKAFNGIKSTNRTFTVTVAKNLAPVWNTEAGTLGGYYAGNYLTIPLSATDPNGKPLTYSIVSGALPSGLTISGSSIVGYMPVVADETVYNFTVRASDGILSADRAFSLTTFADAAPQWITNTGVVATALKGKPISISLLATDPERKALTYTLTNGTSLPNGLSFSPSGAINGIAPMVSNATTYNFTVRASDGVNFTDRNFSIIVDNDAPPVWNTPAGSLGSILSGYAASFPLSVTEPEGQSVTYSVVSGTLPSGIVLNPNTGFLGSPPMGTVPLTTSDQTYNFTVEVTDGTTAVQRAFSITVLKNTDPIWITAPGSLGTNLEGVVVSNTSVSGYDPEGLPVFYTVTAGTFPPGLSLNPNTGVISGTTGSVTEDTTFNFDITLSDGKRTVPQSFTYTINFSSAPIWTTPSGSLGTQLEQTAFTANVAATANGHPITYSMANSTLLPSGLTLNANTGLISGTLPPVSSNTTYNFIIKATDTLTGKSTNRSFSISSIQNLAPVWSTPEGNLYTDLAGTAFSRTLAVSDPNGQQLTLSIVDGSLPSEITFDANTGVVSGTLPVISSDTTYTFTVGAFDGSIRADRTFTITSQFDTAPVWNTNAGSIASALEGAALNILLSATDPQGKSITYTLDNGTTLPSGVTLLANGRILGALPQVAANTTYTFDVLASDGTLSTGRSFSFTSINNLAPVWTTPSGSLGNITETQVFTYQLAATDPEGGTVTYSLANSTAVPNGLQLYSNGAIRGTAAIVSSDADVNFTVRASDSAGNFTDRDFSITVLNDTQYLDPDADKVYYLAHMDGSFIDQYGTIPTLGGSPELANSVGKFGNASVFFPTNVDYLSVPYNSNFNFNTSNTSTTATIEAWFYPTELPNGTDQFAYPLLKKDGSDNIQWAFRLRNDDGKLQAVTYYAGGGGVITVNSTANAITLNEWHHCAVVINGSNVDFYVDFVRIGTSNITRQNMTTPFFINGDGSANKGIVGYIDEIRVSNSIRYSGASVTPVATPFANPPTWVTPSGALAAGVENEVLTLDLDATDPYSTGFLTYSLTNGSTLPSGVTMNAVTGALTGSYPSFYNSAAYSFTVQATDGNGNKTQPRTFSVNPTIATLFGNANALTHSYRFNHPVGDTNYGPEVGNIGPLTAAGTVAYAAAPGQTGTALNLTSFGRLYTNVGSNLNSTLSGDAWTMEFWVYLNAHEQGNRTLFSIGNNRFRFFYLDGNSSGNDFLWHVYMENAGAGGAPVTLSLPANNAISYGAWNHVAIVKDGTSMWMVRNGVAGPVQTVPQNISTAVWQNMTMVFNGYDSGGVGSWSAMRMRDFNIWNFNRYKTAFTPSWNTFVSPVFTSNTSTISVFENSNVAVNAATALPFGSNGTITYSLANNTTLPAGLTLLSNGVISGTAPAYVANANSVTIEIAATDVLSRSSRMSMNVSVLDTAPVWVTNSVLNYSNAMSINLTLQATSPNGQPITYSLANGSVPSGTTFNAGVISGTLPIVYEDTVDIFTVRASSGSKFTDRVFTFTTQAVDPYYSNNGLLMHANGDFADQTGRLTMTGAGLANTSTVSKKFGSGAIYLPGLANSYVRSNALSSAYNLGTRDFTIEAWIAPTNLPGSSADPNNKTGFIFNYGITSSNNTTNSLSVSVTSLTAGKLNQVNIQARNSSGTVILSGHYALPAPVDLGTWHHLAFTRNGNLFSVWFDGVLIGSTTAAVTLTYAANYVFNIGTLMVTGGWDLPYGGYIDEYRITLDRARYTSNFTPSAYPFPNAQQYVPIWTSNATLGSGYKTQIVSPIVNAVSTSSNSMISYSLVSGALPGSTTLNANGMISGTLSNVSIDTVDTFTLRAMDGLGNTADKTFSYTTYALSDPLYANVSTLVKAEDAANSNILIDTTGKMTYSLNGAVVSTANNKFGNSALYFDGTTTKIVQSQANPPGINFGTGDFTIEAWVNLEQIARAYSGFWRAGIVSIMHPTINNNTHNGINLFFQGSDATTVTKLVSTNNGLTVADTLTSLTLNEWHHVAMTRQNGRVTHWIDGANVGSAQYATALNPNTGVTFQIGGLTFTASGGFTYNWLGYIDEVRVTNGVARYTDTFTPPSSSFAEIVDPTPVWVSNANTALGSGGIYYSNATISNQLQATNPMGGTLTYTLTAGALPSGVVLYSNGLVEGNPGVIANNSTGNATILATANSGFSSPQTFNYALSNVSDPYLANVTALLPLSGVVGSTPTEVRFNRTVTKRGNGGVISNATAKFGSTSMATAMPSGGNNSIHVDGIPVMNGNFTVDGWINWNTDGGTGYNIFFGSYGFSPTAGSSLDNIIWYVTSTNTLALYSPGNSPNLIISGGSVTKNVWHHVAWTRSGTTNTLWLNGVSVGSGAWSGILGQGGGVAGRFTYGTYEYSAGTATHPFRGYMQDWRITNGVVRYTSNFTPPTGPYPY